MLMTDKIFIHDFSKLSGVESTTLRYWDEIGIFTPMGRNPETNYRFYSLAQLLALNFVTTLSELEVPLKTISKLREDRDPESLLDILEKLEKQMDLEMSHLRLRYSIIHARRELINLGVKAVDGAILVVPKDEKTIIIWPANEYNESDTFIEPLAAHVSQIAGYHINLSFPVGGYHDSFESFAKAPGRPDHFFSADPVGTHTLKAGDYLTGFAQGYYGQIGDLPERMIAYAKENSLNITGPVYTEYLLDEICVKNPDQYLAQCSIAISKRRKAAR